MSRAVMRRRVRGVAVVPPPSGVAALPQREPRYSQLPPSRASVPTGQVIRLTTSATFADLTGALTTAAGLAVNGTAWVLIPNGADIQAPTGTSPFTGLRPSVVPSFPIVVAQTEWFDGATVYSTGATLTRAQAVSQPVLRSIPITSGAGYEAEPCIRWTSSLDLVMVGIRLHDAADGLGFTRACVEIGDQNSASLTGDNIGHFAAWWCSGGLQQNGAGLPFTAAGAWRAGMGRTFVPNGSGFALRNYYHFGHGAPGEQGANRGVFQGWTSSGPWFVKGCHFENPGGIPFMHGGALQYVGVDCEDVTIEQCRFERTHAWNREHPTLSAVDSNGVRCPYDGKNIGEWKAVNRSLIQDCLFLNDYTRGQTEAVTWKAAWQDGNGTRSSGSADFTFRRNIVTAWNKGVLAFSLSESDVNAIVAVAPNGVDSFVRLTMHDNVFAMELNRPALGTSGDGRARLMLMTRQQDFAGIIGRRTRPPADIQVFNNLFWCFSIGTSDAQGPVFNGFRANQPMSGLRWGRNIIGGALRTGGQNGVEFAYTWADADAGATQFGLSNFTNTAYLPGATIQRDAHIQVDTGAVTPIGATPAPVAYANPAAAGLIATAVDEYSYAGGAALLTADGGERIGPDLATLMAMRANVLAGVVL